MADSPAPTSISVLDSLRELMGPEEILEAAMRLGALERQRKVDMPSLVESTVLALLPVPGAQATVFANYAALTGRSLAPSSFYERFTPEFGQLMWEVADRALAKVREVAPWEKSDELGALLREFSDVRVADSTCHLLKRLAQDWAPSTSKQRPAGIKLHAVVSLRDGLPLADELSPQKLHDNRAFPEWTLEAGTLSLFDLGYLDVDRFIDAIEREAGFLTRLKQSHNPLLSRVHVGKGDKVRARGMRLDEAFEQGVLTDFKGLLDVDIRLEKDGRKATARVVAVPGPDGERHWYLTNVPRDMLSPDDVAETYRLRWAIELIWKQLKAGLGLKTILAWRPGAVAALVAAKVTGLCLARLLELSLQEREGQGR